MIEHVGLAEVGEAQKYFKFSGDRDYFPNTNIVWRVVAENVLDEEEQYNFDRDAEKFPDVNLPGREVMWTALPTDDVPIHLRKANDYLLSDHPSNVAARSGPGRSPAGFQPQQLPSLP